MPRSIKYLLAALFVMAFGVLGYAVTRDFPAPSRAVAEPLEISL